MNTTIGEYFTQFSELSVTSVGHQYETTQIYLKILGQPDSQLTVVPFPVHKLLGALSYSVLEQFAIPVWNGHVVSKIELWASFRLLVCQAFVSYVSCESHNMISNFLVIVYYTASVPTWCLQTKLTIFLNMIIEGQILAYTDIQDGLVVNTMAGYPMKFLKYPNFTINGNVVLIGDIRCTNGIVQNVDTVPDPLVPWMYKTNYDVLLEVNSQQDGNLSDFIASIFPWAQKHWLMQ